MKSTGTPHLPYQTDGTCKYIPTVNCMPILIYNFKEKKDTTRHGILKQLKKKEREKAPSRPKEIVQLIRVWDLHVWGSWIHLRLFLLSLPFFTSLETNKTTVLKKLINISRVRLKLNQCVNQLMGIIWGTASARPLYLATYPELASRKMYVFKRNISKEINLFSFCWSVPYTRNITFHKHNAHYLNYMVSWSDYSLGYASNWNHLH